MPSKPFNQVPYDPGLSDQTKQCLDYLLQQVNQLVGQGNTPPSKNIQTFGNNIIDPTSSQIISGGNRTGSVTTAIAFTSTTTSISFFWDGSNGSKPFTIYRDDGSVTGPTIAGSGLTVTGLTANTQYFFYPFWDESQSKISFATVQGVAVGTPPIAFTVANLLAAQQQFLRGHIPLSPGFANAGITTPSSGSGGGSGGGGGGGGGGNCPLSGAPVRLYGDPAWWTKTVKPCWEFLEIVTETGRRGTFSRPHRMYQQHGCVPLYMWRVGDKAVTEDGEELVVEINPKRFEGTVDSYEATKGHLYSAWGFVCHNLKPF